MKKSLSLLLSIIILLCFTACNGNTTDKTSSTRNSETYNTLFDTHLSDKTSSTKNSETYDTLFDTYPSVFITKNITNITFYAYYGGGKGSNVPAENMTEIINWLDTFIVDREATDEDVLDGTNTYYVKIEYSDGTIIKEGIDVISIDGTRYLLKKEPYPSCFENIISKTSLN